MTSIKEILNTPKPNFRALAIDPSIQRALADTANVHFHYLSEGAQAGFEKATQHLETLSATDILRTLCGKKGYDLLQREGVFFLDFSPTGPSFNDKSNVDLYIWNKILSPEENKHVSLEYLIHPTSPLVKKLITQIKTKLAQGPIPVYLQKAEAADKAYYALVTKPIRFAPIFKEELYSQLWAQRIVTADLPEAEKARILMDVCDAFI